MATLPPSRDPRFNHLLDPYYNHIANPKYNREINPDYNTVINVRHNAEINPDYNYMMNPRRNATINYKYNPEINPNFNPNLNPKFNIEINPKFTIDIKADYLFNHSNRLTGIAVPVQSQEKSYILLYNLNLEFLAIAIGCNENFYNVFDTDNDSVGFLIKTQIGFNIYDIQNRWKAFIVNRQ